MKFPYNDIISLLDERLDLNIAESTNKDLVLEEIWDESFSRGLRDLKLEYGTSQGSEELRALIAKKLAVTKEKIIITNGSAFGIFLSILNLCDKGDEVLTVQPNFPPTMDLIDGLGFEKKLLKLSFETGYKLDEEALFDAVSEKTKLIILVSPLNPSGTVHSQEEIEAIASRLEVEYPDCRLLIDETYREATYGNNMAIPTFAGLRNNVIIVSSLSKCHGTPGLRIGWLYANDPDFIKEVAIVKMNTVISNSVLDEYVATQVLKKESEIFLARRIHSAKGLELTRKWVEEHEQLIAWIEPSAGALCCIRLNEKQFDTAKLDKFYDALRASGIQVANGEWFGETKRYFRLGFGYMNIDQLAPTLDRIGEILKEIREG